jgi:hypothetical protein
MIQELISHDDRTDAIHLFLRTRTNTDYTYCGVLGYLVHDEDREEPVHFQWQLLDWPASRATLESMGLVLVPTTAEGVPTSDEIPRHQEPAATLVLDEVPPPKTERGAATTRTFRARKRAFHPDQDARNRVLGLAGEELVLEAERHRLKSAGRPDLADKVIHVSLVEGDGAGYDIRSFDEEGEERHLEVKTTRSGIASGFFLSPNEIAFSDAHPTTFVLIRVFDYDPDTKSGRCYRSPGALTESFSLTVSEYRASPKS